VDNLVTFGMAGRGAVASVQQIGLHLMEGRVKQRRRPPIRIRGRV
jgi:hypothetical protein